MKRPLLHAVIIIIVICALTSCSGTPSQGPAHPGDVSVYSDSADIFTTIPGYPAETNSDQRPSVLSSTTDSSRQAAQNKVIIFKGKEYQATFRMSYNISLRHYAYDAYTCGSFADSTLMEFHIAGEGDEEKLVGFRYNVNVSELPQVVTKTEAELIEIATAALDELTDADYYAHTSVEFTGDFPMYTVWFYNSISDIWLADTSYVELAVDGTVIAVEALPEPALRSAANFSELDIDEFDDAIEAQVAQSYPHYSCDNDQMLAAVTNTGAEISWRKITTDDDGRPIMMYRVTPQLSYDITYRGEWAEAVTSRGDDVHQTGTYKPPVYAAVYLTDQ